MSKVKHIALFKFKESITPEQMDKVFEELIDLSENVEGIEDYVSGPNISPEGLSQGFTHGFVMTFTDLAAHDAYLPHPEHERVKASIMEVIETMAVLDFEV